VFTVLTLVFDIANIYLNYLMSENMSQLYYTYKFSYTNTYKFSYIIRPCHIVCSSVSSNVLYIHYLYLLYTVPSKKFHSLYLLHL
jgi:hypothetical protein